MAALPDGVCEHAVEPDRRQQDAQEDEETEEHSAEARQDQRRSGHLGHRAEVADRQMRIDLVDRSLQDSWRGSFGRVEAHDGGPRRPCRRDRCVGERSRLLAERAILAVGDDPHDLVGVARLTDPDSLAERLLARPEALGERLVDDHDSSFFAPLVLREAPPCEDRHAKRREVVLVHGGRIDVGPVLLGQIASFGRQLPGVDPHHQRQVTGKAGRLDPGLGPQSLGQ